MPFTRASVACPTFHSDDDAFVRLGLMAQKAYRIAFARHGNDEKPQNFILECTVCGNASNDNGEREAHPNHPAPANEIERIEVKRFDRWPGSSGDRRR